MGTASAPTASPSNPADRPPSRRARFRGLGRTGLAIVLLVSAVTALRTTTKFLVTQSLADWFVAFAIDFAYNAFIGTAMLLAAVWSRNRHPRSGSSQYLVVFVAVMLAAALALLAVALWETRGTLGSEDSDWMFGGWLAYMGSEWVLYAVVGLVITGAWLYVCTESEHVSAIEQCAVDSARMDQQSAEARLQMLEAQIEPHFLFNTLAHVKRLYETDRAAGARMLRNLKAYLAVALPQMRAAESTLGREIDHAVAYLNIQQIRMGRRLAFGVDVPSELRALRMPPLMLLTLVENAIKHGLSPLPEGGRIDIHASVDNGLLRIDVADSGQGFAKSGGGGTGLANIRARLASQFGPDARLALAFNQPRGVIATLVLPCQPASTSRGNA